jgi:hypothetical protein
VGCKRLLESAQLMDDGILLRLTHLFAFPCVHLFWLNCARRTVAAATRATRRTMGQDHPKCKETLSHSEYYRFRFFLVLMYRYGSLGVPLVPKNHDTLEELFRFPRYVERINGQMHHIQVWGFFTFLAILAYCAPCRRRRWNTSRCVAVQCTCSLTRCEIFFLLPLVA